MTVIDETSRVPALDAEAIARLRAAVDRPAVLAAMLFGSQARGSAGPLSDIDIAVIHREPMDSQQRLDLRLGLAADAGAALGTSEVDLVLLNGAPPLLRDRVLRDAVVLVDRDPAATSRFKQQTDRDYAATEQEREQLSRRLRLRIQDGSFGRRS